MKYNTHMKLSSGKIDQIYLRQIFFGDTDGCLLYGYFADTVTPFIFYCMLEDLHFILDNLDETGKKIIQAVTSHTSLPDHVDTLITIEEIINVQEYYIDCIEFSIDMIYKSSDLGFEKLCTFFVKEVKRINTVSKNPELN